MKNKDDATEAAMLFSVPDFVGDACKAIASRVRGSVASVQFDDFHKVTDIVLHFSPHSPLLASPICCCFVDICAEVELWSVLETVQ